MTLYAAAIHMGFIFDEISRHSKNLREALLPMCSRVVLHRLTRRRLSS